MNVMMTCVLAPFVLVACGMADTPADSDGDGTTTLAEFETYVAQRMAGMSEADRTAFAKRVDADGDGAISGQEFANRRALMGAPGSRAPGSGTEDGGSRARPELTPPEELFDLTGLSIPRDEVISMVPMDGIPALTDPSYEPVAEASWLEDDARVAVVEISEDVAAFPLAILGRHEIVNTSIGGKPIAVTYCPLCDSVTVFSRTVEIRPGMAIPGLEPREEEQAARTITLEFGVSGTLYNSNVLMYDRTDKALWSQLSMQAVSGPHVGEALKVLPTRMMRADAFKEKHTGGKVLSLGAERYRRYIARSPYDWYFKSDELMVPVKGMGSAFAKKKTLGVGVVAGEKSWFVSADALRASEGGMELETPLGVVKLSANEAGISVDDAPAGVKTAQTFYYSWSAFYPETIVVKDPAGR